MKLSHGDVPVKGQSGRDHRPWHGEGSGSALTLVSTHVSSERRMRCVYVCQVQQSVLSVGGGDACSDARRRRRVS